MSREESRERLLDDEDTGPASSLSDGQLVGPPKNRTLVTVCPYILGNEFCERLAYYGLATNLVVYMTRVMGQDASSAAFHVNLWGGSCYLTPLLGAYLADSKWGRYKAIMVFSWIYQAGMVLLALSAGLPGLTPKRDDEKASFLQFFCLYSSLYIIAVGTGGIKPNVSAFGADQFDPRDPQECADKESFFNWFYLAVNVGSLIASLVIVYIQENISWAIGFLIPGVCMMLAVLVFMWGSAKYKHLPATESPISRVAKVVYQAWANRGKIVPEFGERTLRGARMFAVYGIRIPSTTTSHAVSPPAGLDSALALTPAPAAPDAPDRPHVWLEKACLPLTSRTEILRPGFKLHQVEEVKLVLNVLPIWSCLIIYWAIYSQMGSMFVMQGEQMRRTFEVNGLTFKLPAASMSAFNTISIIVLIPLWDQVCMPYLTNLGRRPSLLQRIGWGMIIAVTAMMSMYWIEAARLAAVSQGRVLAPHSSHEYAMADVSILWQIIPYWLIGASEILTAIGALEFFYDQAPDIMRSCMMALELASSALGSYLAGVLILVVDAFSGWITADLNKGRLDLFFLFLAALMLGNTVVFAVVASAYKYKVVHHTFEDGTESDDDGTDVDVEKQSPPLPVRAAGHEISTASAQTTALQAVTEPVRRKKEPIAIRPIPGPAPAAAAAVTAAAAAAADIDIPSASPPFGAPLPSGSRPPMGPRPPMPKGGRGGRGASGLSAALAGAPPPPIAAAVPIAGPSQALDSLAEDGSNEAMMGTSFADYAARALKKKGKKGPGRAVEKEEDLLGRSLAYRGASPKLPPAFY